jgi:hypothetical protein
MRAMRPVVALVLGLALAAPVAAHAAAASCAPGRFVVSGGPLEGAGNGGDVIVMTDSAVSIANACGPTRIVQRRTKRAIFVVARWKRGSCAPFRHAVLRFSIDRATCNQVTGVWKARYSSVRRPPRHFRATRQKPAPTCNTSDDTYTVIQQRIFGTHGCAVASCHGSFAQGGLELLAGTSYAQLVGVAASNPVAAAAGKVRVVPGDPGASFLVQKLRGTLAAGEGDAMPRVGTPLDADELALVEAWIQDGAPRTGWTDSTPCLAPRPFEPARPLAPPPGGHQLVFDGPMLQPGEQRETCMWVRTPNSADFTVGRWEFSLNPGTHHFAVFNWDKAGAPPVLGALGDDPGCISGAMFGATLSGSPQAPYYVDALPPGLARVLRAGGYLGLNAHYANEFDVPIQMKVWINIHPYAGTPEHLVETVTDYDDMFTIDVSPRTQRVLHGRFVNQGPSPMAFVQLVGHMHKRGLRFTAWASDGSQLLEDLDWAHPHWRPFTPPLVLAPGDHLDFECLHDNGVTRPLKLDPFGNPTRLKFGLTADDEMCTLSGSWYPLE